MFMKAKNLQNLTIVRHYTDYPLFGVCFKGPLH